MVQKDMIIIFLFLTSFVTFSTSMHAFRRNEGKSSLPFALLMLAASIHSFGYTFELLSSNQNIGLLWINFEYIGISFFPYLFLSFSMEHRKEESFKNTVLLIVFFAFSLTTFILVQTNSLHHLYYKYIELDVSGDLSKAIFERGIWYYVHSLILFVAIIISIITSYSILRNSKESYRGRAFYTMVSLMIPLIIGILFILNMTPKNMDILTFTYGPMALIWIIGLIKYGITELVPVTYKEIFEHISEGVIVIDKNDIIVNFNSAAHNILQPVIKLHKGTEILEVLKELKFISSGQYQGKVFEIKQKSIYKIFQLKKTNMFDIKDRYVGKILVLNDISRESEATKVLTTLATRDELTGISNRRHFFETCSLKISEARESKEKVSFVIMDIDHFKSVNDTYGHFVGDKVLKEVSDICRNGLRGTDLIGRYGGEEFAILIYDTALEVTHSIIDRIRTNIGNHVFRINETESFKLTVSFGIYRPEMLKEENMDTIFKKADKGLYKAKSDGRDCIVFYDDKVC